MRAHGRPDLLSVKPWFQGFIAEHGSSAVTLLSRRVGTPTLGFSEPRSGLQDGVALARDARVGEAVTDLVAREVARRDVVFRHAVAGDGREAVGRSPEEVGDRE